MEKNLGKKIFIFALILFNVYVWNIIFSFGLLKTSVNFLDVGQGDATLISGKAGNVLIDAGKRNYVLKSLSKVLPFFDKIIDVAIVTHADVDHFEGLFFILDYYKVRVVVLNDFYADNDKYQKLLQKLIEKKIKIVYGIAGANIGSNDFKIDIIYPKQNQIDIKKTNENSIVADVFALEKKFLLTGDINNKILMTILKDGLVGQVDVLKLPHHGAKNSIDSECLKKMDIKDVVVSVGNNSYGHPSSAIVDLIKSFNLKVLRTDEKGTIRFFQDKTLGSVP